jgi:hypothetical protein
MPAVGVVATDRMAGKKYEKESKQSGSLPQTSTFRMLFITHLNG